MSHRFLVLLLALAGLGACARAAGEPSAAPAPRETATQQSADVDREEAMQRIVAALERVERVEVEPESLELAAGDTAYVDVRFFDAAGERVLDAGFGVSGGTGIIQVELADGHRVRVVGLRPGDARLEIHVPTPPFTLDDAQEFARHPVHVTVVAARRPGPTALGAVAEGVRVARETAVRPEPLATPDLREALAGCSVAATDAPRGERPGHVEEDGTFVAE